MSCCLASSACLSPMWERLKENEKRVKERERPKSINKQKRHDWVER